MHVAVPALLTALLIAGGLVGIQYQKEQVALQEYEAQVAEQQFGATYIRSLQLAADPDNGECLETNGTDNVWDTCASGGGGSGTVSTSTNETKGTLAYWTSNSGTPALLGTVATTTLTATSPLSLSNTVVKVGGSNSVLSIATSTLFGAGTPGQVLGWDGTKTTWVATSTCIDITGSADLCDGSDATAVGAADPFTWATNFSAINAATSSNLWVQEILNASSTSNFHATSTFWSALKVGTSTARSNQVQIDCNKSYSASQSVGGCVHIDNTDNMGAAMLVYSSAGAGATAPQFRVRNDDTEYDQQLIDFTSSSITRTVLGIGCANYDQGCAKLAHTSDGPNNADAAALSIQLNGTSTQSAAQGIFMTSTAFGTTGKLLNLWNMVDGAAATNQLTLTYDGKLGLGTTTPYAKLSVVGEAVARNFTATSTNATSTLPKLNIGDSIDLFGNYSNSRLSFCTSMTLGADLCDGADADTTYTFGDHVTLTGSDVDVDDDFLLNTGDTGTGLYILDNASTTLFSTAKSGRSAWFRNTTDGNNEPTVMFEGDRATPTDGDKSYVSFGLSDDAGTQSEFGRMTIQGDDINVGTSIDGRFIWGVTQAGTLTNELGLTGTLLYPVADDGLALGTTGNAFADLHLNTGGVINWEGGEVTLTESTTGLTLSSGDVFTASNASTTILTNSGVASTTSLIVSNLNAASCDVKASSTGVLSCGTDATGGGAGGTGTVSTSTNEVANQVAVFTSNSATPALVGGDADFTFSGDLLTVTNASTSRFTAFNEAKFGATATTTIASDGQLTTPSIRPTSDGSGSIGATGLAFGDVFLNGGSAINFENDSISHASDMFSIVSAGLTISTGALLVDADGVQISGNDGLMTIAGIGNGNDENLTFDFDNAAANVVDIDTGTGVTTIDWSALNLTTTGLITAGSLTVSGHSILNTASTTDLTIAGSVKVGYETLGFTYATTSWVGTTTVLLGPAMGAQTFSGGYCETTTGTVGVSLYDGTNRALPYIPTASTTANFNAITSVNTFTKGESRRVDIGTPASSPVKIACTFKFTYTDDL